MKSMRLLSAAISLMTFLLVVGRGGRHAFATAGGVLVLVKFYWAPDIVEFVLGRFSHFNIAIAYSNSIFCGAWTPSFCEFTQNFSKTSTPQALVKTFQNLINSGVCSFCWNFSERQILWSLCSVDFHTLTLQLPIQTPHSVAPELQVFVSSLKISAKRAHPWVQCYSPSRWSVL